MVFKYTIEKNPGHYDHDTVRFANGGCGYIGRKNWRFGLLHCPKCHLENYYSAVPDGVCAWCGCKPMTDAEEVA